MKIRLLNDLHRETGPFTYVDAGEDVVVLAGDIDNGIKGIEWAKTIPKPVIYVAGNHDSWGCDLYDNMKAMRTAAKGSNVKFLECGEAIITIRGERVRFLGATMWTDYCAEYLRKNGDRSDRVDMQQQMMWVAEQSMRDFSQITYKQKKMTPQILLKIHQKSRAWLEMRLKKHFNGQTVVVTHHAPSYQSLIHANMVSADELPHVIQGNRRRDDRAMRVASYASYLEDITGKVDFWLHGHIHAQMMYNINKCMVACNPRGYNVKPLTTDEFWFYVSEARAAESLERYNKEPERGDVHEFNKALILDTVSTMPKYMLAKATGALKEIESVLAVMVSHVKYTRYKDNRVVAMGINKVNAQIVKYNALIKDVLYLICHAQNVKTLGDPDLAAIRLGWDDRERPLMARGSLVDMEFTEEMPESYFESASENAKRALKVMKRAVTLLKVKLSKSEA